MIEYLNASATRLAVDGVKVFDSPPITRGKAKSETTPEPNGTKVPEEAKARIPLMNAEPLHPQ